MTMTMMMNVLACCRSTSRSIGLVLHHRPLSLYKPNNYKTHAAAFRLIGSGTSNPEERNDTEETLTRANPEQTKEEQDDDDSSEDNEETPSKFIPVITRIDPNDIPPLPDHIRTHYKPMETFIKKQFMPMFPLGVGMKRLRYDLAIRFKKGNPFKNHKLAYEIVYSIVGEVSRRSNYLLEIRKKSGKGGDIFLKAPPKGQRSNKKYGWK